MVSKGDKLSETSALEPGVRVVKGSFFIFLNYACLILFGVAYNVLIARFLGPSGYGIVAVALALFNTLVYVTCFALPQATARCVSKYMALKKPTAVRKVLHISLKYLLSSAIVFSVALAVLSGPIAASIFHNPNLVNAFRAVAIIIPFYMIMLWFIGAFQGFGRIKYLFFTESSYALFRVPLAAVFIFTGFYATGALLGTAAGMLLACTVGLIFLVKIMPKGGKGREIPGISREILSFSAATWIGSLAGMIILSYGTLFVGSVLGMENTGLYSVPLAIAMLLLYVPGMVTTPLFPVISELWTVGDKEKLASVLRASTKLIFSVFVPLMVVMIVFPEFILTLFFGKEFVAGSIVLRILAISMAFWCIKTVNDTILGGIGKPGLNAKIYWMAAVFAVVTITPLVLSHGIMGAAVALLMVLVLLAFLGTFFVIRSTGLNYFSKAFWKPWIAAGVMLVAIMALRFLVTGLAQAIFIGIIGLLIYFVTFLAIGGIEKGEIHALKRISSDMGKPSLLERIIRFLEVCIRKEK